MKHLGELWVTPEDTISSNQAFPPSQSGTCYQPVSISLRFCECALSLSPEKAALQGGKSTEVAVALALPFWVASNDYFPSQSHRPP